MINSKLWKEFQIARNSEDISAYFALKNKLLNSNSIEIMKFHYSLFAEQCNDELKQYIISSFSERGINGKTFLLDKIIKENDNYLLSVIIQLLGVMRAKELLPYIRKFSIKHQDEGVKYRSVMTLGWLGTSKDLTILFDIQKNNQNYELKKLAITQQMHIQSRYNIAKNKIFKHQYQELLTEEDETIIATIVYILQEIKSQKFGISEDYLGNFRGDIEKAKRKAMRMLKKEGLELIEVRF